MAELSLLLLVVAATGLAIAWPLLDREPMPARAPADEEDDARAVRHRLALEALRDLEADRRAGSLDDERYAVLRAEADARAAETLPSADHAPSGEPLRAAPGGRRLALAIGAGLLALMLIGFALPQPVGIAERTATDQPLADAIAAEDARQAEIARLQAMIADDPTNAQVFSDLADAYLAGPSFDDQRRGATALLVVLSLDPEDASAYRRLITAYINAADWIDARSALDSYAEIAAPEEPDIPFFRGLIALRGDGDEDEAVRQFDRFLELAPHDARAGMVLSLREQAAGSE
jgi:tetratricopeptide (TPR) repeat protein